MQKFTIYGPPGTGKTTYLLSLLQEDLKTIEPQRLAFVSYTKKGTYEGAERAKKAFNLRSKDLRYFRTIHSLCFQAIGATKLDMLGKEQYELLSERTGYDFVGYYTSDFISESDFILHTISMLNHNEPLARKLMPLINEQKFNFIKDTYNAMKQQLYMFDFDDLLLEYLKKGKSLDIDVAYVDEGQDLTTLQWKVIDKMFAKAKKITVAGDDDQAIYEWAGADFKKFLSFSKDMTILDQSYRLPSKVLKLADNLTSKIVTRQKKAFKPRPESGEVEYATALNQIDFKGGELILARTNYLLKKLAYELYDLGIPFIKKGKNSVNNATLNAIKAYELFVKGLMTEEDFRVHKIRFVHVSKNVHWTQVLKTSKQESFYYQKLLMEGHLDKDPVLLETYHSCKGSENGHVILLTDITKKVFSMMGIERDSELRCLYVALTRVKKKLTILSPNSKFHYNYDYFT